jgi:hypothetical protein
VGAAGKKSAGFGGKEIEEKGKGTQTMLFFFFFFFYHSKNKTIGCLLPIHSNKRKSYEYQATNIKIGA